MRFALVITRDFVFWKLITCFGIGAFLTLRLIRIVNWVIYESERDNR